uniref:uncharacterized protein n=1 Tax=Pristiophorus japonicus TaxID=55135 RepID=UPI00398E89AF
MNNSPRKVLHGLPSFVSGLVQEVHIVSCNLDCVGKERRTALEVTQLQRRIGRPHLPHCNWSSPRVLRKRRPPSQRRRNLWKRRRMPFVSLKIPAATSSSSSTEEVAGPSDLQQMTPRCTVPTPTSRRLSQRGRHVPQRADRHECMYRLCMESVAISRELLQAFGGLTGNIARMSARISEDMQLMIREMREQTADIHALRHARLVGDGTALQGAVPPTTSTHASQEEKLPSGSEVVQSEMSSPHHPLRGSCHRHPSPPPPRPPTPQQHALRSPTASHPGAVTQGLNRGAKTRGWVQNLEGSVTTGREGGVVIVVIVILFLLFFTFIVG